MSGLVNVNKSFDVEYKVIIIGDSKIGKSSILKRATHQEFSENTVSTVGIDFVQIYFLVEGANVKLNVWDTAGQERFRTITKSHFRNTKGIILTFDLTSLDSFNTLEYWMRTIVDMNLDSEVIYLVGNKLDVVNEREVSYEKGRKYADRNLIKYFEISAKNGTNLQGMFNSLAYDVLEMNNMEKMERYNYKKAQQRNSFVYAYNMSTEIVLKDTTTAQKFKHKTLGRKYIIMFKKRGLKYKAPVVTKTANSSTNVNKNSVIFSTNMDPCVNASNMMINNKFDSKEKRKSFMSSKNIKLSRKSLFRMGNSFNCCKIS